MSAAAEAMYFDHEPVAHIVAYDERKRLARIRQQCRAAIASRGRKYN